MGELNLDKIERVYPPVTGKKYDLESERVLSGRLVPGYLVKMKRDLTKELTETAEDRV